MASKAKPQNINTNQHHLKFQLKTAATWLPVAFVYQSTNQKKKKTENE